MKTPRGGTAAAAAVGVYGPGPISKHGSRPSPRPCGVRYGGWLFGRTIFNRYVAGPGGEVWWVLVYSCRKKTGFNSDLVDRPIASCFPLGPDSGWSSFRGRKLRGLEPGREASESRRMNALLGAVQ
jgi:hypothetical protein